jgi:multicomponent Na+:H+ antiporter subunit F
VTALTYLVLTAAAAAFCSRLLRGPSLPERVIAADGLIVVGVSAIAVHAMSTGRGSFLPVLVVITLVGFVGTSASARFIERTAGGGEGTAGGGEGTAGGGEGTAGRREDAS